ncbi:hypothetical protein RB600_001284 [Gaeumannomyces tritici]
MRSRKLGCNWHFRLPSHCSRPGGYKTQRTAGCPCQQESRLGLSPTSGSRACRLRQCQTAKMSAEDDAFDAMVEGLADSVTTLEGDLKPLLENFAEISSKLPVLDQAKLNVLLAYSIESLLFSALRLEGVDAKNHDVFKELTRTRQYFEKITKAETPPEPRPENATINKQAAIRFIRADLVGFSSYFLLPPQMFRWLTSNHPSRRTRTTESFPTTSRSS